MAFFMKHVIDITVMYITYDNNGSPQLPYTSERRYVEVESIPETLRQELVAKLAEEWSKDIHNMESLFCRD